MALGAWVQNLVSLCDHDSKTPLTWRDMFLETRSKNVEEMFGRLEWDPISSISVIHIYYSNTIVKHYYTFIDYNFWYFEGSHICFCRRPQIGLICTCIYHVFCLHFWGFGPILQGGGWHCLISLHLSPWLFGLIVCTCMCYKEKLLMKLVITCSWRCGSPKILSFLERWSGGNIGCLMS